MTEPLRRHVFHPSGQRDYGVRICVCGSKEFDTIHVIRDVTDEERELDARRIGERRHDDE